MNKFCKIFDGGLRGSVPRIRCITGSNLN